MALHSHHHLDIAFHLYNPDSELHPTFKEAWCKRLSPYAMPEDFVEQVSPQLFRLEADE